MFLCEEKNYDCGISEQIKCQNLIPMRDKNENSEQKFKIPPKYSIHIGITGRENLAWIEIYTMPLL